MDPEFARKHREWVRCLSQKESGTDSLDRNCILAQVYDLMWSAAAFRTVQEARALAEPLAGSAKKQSWLLHHLLNRSFYSAQAVAIRRLMDTGTIDGKKGVFALAPLIRDIRAHAALITRSNYFAAAELSLDFEAVKRAEWEFHENKASTCRSTTYFLPNALDSGEVKRLHETFDRLSGKAAANRTAQDTIAPRVFENLVERIARTRAICQHVDKFIAHAATPESREQIDERASRIYLAELWEAHELVCRLVQFLDQVLLRGMSHGLLPEFHGDQFEYIDVPLVRPEEVDILREKWQSFAAEVGSWGEGSLAWVIGQGQPESEE
ncbi:MAG: hypothetical protein KF869_15285 [Phycisphaeraceae bacterium]|nr:hypothetical protein [Phycisphaeraceae bacterium]